MGSGMDFNEKYSLIKELTGTDEDRAQNVWVKVIELKLDDKESITNIVRQTKRVYVSEFRNVSLYRCRVNSRGEASRALIDLVDEQGVVRSIRRVKSQHSSHRLGLFSKIEPMNEKERELDKQWYDCMRKLINEMS